MMVSIASIAALRISISRTYSLRLPDDQLIFFENYGAGFGKKLADLV